MYVCGSQSGGDSSSPATLSLLSLNLSRPPFPHPQAAAPRAASSTPPSSAPWPSSCTATTQPWHLAALDWGDGTPDGDAAAGSVCAPPPPGARNLAGTRHGGACGAAVGAPKVALLFLTKGGMAHDAMWAAWLDAVGGVVPADCARAAACAAGGGGGGGGTAGGALLARLQEECAGGGDPLSRQGLFSVYVHVPKGGALASPAPGSPFTERTLIPGRVATEWGGFTLASATKALMRAALSDRANQRFALLSEACVPLYAPQVGRIERACFFFFFSTRPPSLSYERRSRPPSFPRPPPPHTPPFLPAHEHPIAWLNGRTHSHGPMKNTPPFF